MKTIHKFQIPVAERCVLSLPKAAKIIRCEDVDGLFYVWAIVDTEEVEMVNRHLELYKTGAPIETPLNHLQQIGQCRIYVQMELILYVFENMAKVGHK